MTVVKDIISSHVAFKSKLVISSCLQAAHFSAHDDDADADDTDHHDHDDDDGDDDNDDGDDDDGLGLNYKVLDMSTQIAGQNNIQCTEYDLLCFEILSSK